MHRCTRKEYADKVYRYRLQARAFTYVYTRIRICIRVHIHAHPYKRMQNAYLQNKVDVPCSVCGRVLAFAWWVCVNAQFNLGERNCSAGIIVSRNPDDSGQVTVNQRTTTPLFKVIIRDR